MKTLLLFTLLTFALSAHAKQPALQLANTYQDALDLKQYWVSEKYDGVRAYWDGKSLISRNGNPIYAPTSFISQLPRGVHLDGELWLGRNKFEDTVSIVRRNVARPGSWDKIRYRVFDLPKHSGLFFDRYAAMQQLHDQDHYKRWEIVEQHPIHSKDTLFEQLHHIEKQGGEGLMLRKIDSPSPLQTHLLPKSSSQQNQPHRNNDLVKLKTYKDAEAIVIAYKEGKGKYRGQMGSLQVKTPTGITFYIGTGFTDKERQSPPAIGSLITYKYYGLTQAGKPRFASFLRKRLTVNQKSIRQEPTLQTPH